MRLNLFLARAAGGSRREADGWIQNGRVRVNGAPPESIGIAVEPETDKVTLDGKSVTLPKAHRYLAYHKPRGLLVSRRSQGGRTTVFDALGSRARGLHAVGRLDMDSEGLILLTDDGTLSESLLHPRSALVRKYRVWVRPIPTPTSLKTLTAGARIEGERVAPLRVVHEGAERGLGILMIELAEGKKREVKLLARAAGLHVTRLLRVQFGPIHLATLQLGAVRPLRPAEIEALRAEAFPATGSGC